MISSLSALSLAITFLLTFDFNDTSSYAVSAIRRKDKSKNRPTIKVESFRIVSAITDFTYIQADGTSLTVNAPPKKPAPTLSGSQFILNGNVYHEDQITVNGAQIVEWVPEPTVGFFFNQQCTAVKGILDFDKVPTVKVLENICNYNFCIPDGSCLFLRSGGPFEFNVLNQTAAAVPAVKATVIGGTQRFLGVFGEACITQLVVPGNNEKGRFEMDMYEKEMYEKEMSAKGMPEKGMSVLQFDLTTVDIIPNFIML